MTKVDYVTFNDTSTDEKICGYLTRDIHDGAVIWRWKVKELVYPLRRIDSINTSYQ